MLVVEPAVAVGSMECWIGSVFQSRERRHAHQAVAIARTLLSQECHARVVASNQAVDGHQTALLKSRSILIFMIFVDE